MIQASFDSRLPLILAEQERLFKAARRKAAANLVYECMLVTLPNSVSKLPLSKFSASKALKKEAITKQRARIKRDILGEDSKFKQAPVAGDGSILQSKIKGKSRIPLVVPKTGSGRKKKNAAPPPQPKDIITSAEAVRKYLKQHTYLAWRKGSATRIRKRNAPFRWVSKDALKAAAAYLVGTAAGLMSGWEKLASLSNAAKFASIVSGRSKKNAPGSAKMTDDNGKLQIAATNRGLPASPAVKRYQESQVNAYIPKKWEYAIVNECQQALIALNKFIRRLK